LYNDQVANWNLKQNNVSDRDDLLGGDNGDTLPLPVTANQEQTSRGANAGTAVEGGSDYTAIFRRSSHPYAMASFMFFRFSEFFVFVWCLENWLTSCEAALLTYLLGVLFTSNLLEHWRPILY
jgi:hypothetical protein